jgi:hypothetical protein
MSTSAVVQPAVYEIPLLSAPQQLEITLSAVDYRLRLTWCWPIECWMLDIYDANTLAPLLLGYAMVTGADLLEQFVYLGFPGSFFVQTSNDTLAQPTFDNLGYLSHLFYAPFNQGAASG